MALFHVGVGWCHAQLFILAQDVSDKLESTGVNEKPGIFGGITLFAESPT